MKLHALFFAVLFILIPLSSFAESAADGITKPFTRIISLYPAHTENLVRMGALKELIGVGTEDDYPPEIQGRPRFSYHEDAEKFIAAKPDLVLVRPMIERSHPQLVAKLRAAHITVISLQPHGMAGLFKYWQELGKLSGHVKESRKMILDFENEILRLQQEIASWQESHNLLQPKVYFEVMHSKSRTIAAGSIAAYVLKEAGGINIARDAKQVRTTNIAFYPTEKLLSKGSKIDIFIAQQGRMNAVNREIIEQEPGYNAIRAVREGKIYLVPEELVSRPTMRILEGISTIARILYPGIKL